jgi:chromate reductase, NAD(P)H dehydrogenase (quinone)
MEKIKIVAFAGSFRSASYNRMALKYAVRGAEEAGAEVDVVDLKEISLPVYDKDIETHGFPENVKNFKNRVRDADGVLIATPEYNWSLPGGLKNAIDWVSRETNEFQGKTVAYFGVSDGYFGTVRSQIVILPTLITLGMYILPRKVYIPNGGDEFDEDGKLKNSKIEGKLKKLGADLVDFTRKLK